MSAAAGIGRQLAPSKKGLRIFVAAWYLLGWMSHVYFGLAVPQIYRPF